MEALSNLQLELLKVYSRPVSEDDLLAIRRFLANYFSEKAMNLADAAWDNNGWTEADSERLMNEHSRKSGND
ncbi:hypothetical protein [Dyadobacter luticola]|uniref:Uncharacterized protein n=1 Tax=Dyadobacter luticola TaxID=1979387 RepID=A0A5R9KWG5_9BACT|nr:hypothetical protein [Dyadobacter luticola]TLV00613.1 hypothetical protein FEN17_14090 [Dyadobacter luticola]